MDESEWLFNLVYFLACMCIIYPPLEFHHLELTIEKIFSRFLGDEKTNFVKYHQKRTCLNLFVHSCLPAIYFLIYKFKFSIFTDDKSYSNDHSEKGYDISWKFAQNLSILIMLAVPAIIFYWSQQNWKNHPISKEIKKYSIRTETYEEQASSICTEFQRPNIYMKKLNSISAVIATENWLIKTSLYKLYFAHQRDTTLSFAKSETFNTYQNDIDALQMVSIVVKPNRRDVADFHIRINSVEIINLEQRLTRPIANPTNIKFHKNIIDHFIDEFKKEIKKNPSHQTDDDVMDKCYACMTNHPNVKIHKNCEDIDHDTGLPLPEDLCCSNCNCRPMWCVDCLARWFAVRQNDVNRNEWFGKTATCPLCRAKFCLLDVSYLTPIMRPATTHT